MPVRAIAEGDVISYCAEGDVISCCAEGDVIPYRAEGALPAAISAAFSGLNHHVSITPSA